MRDRTSSLAIAAVLGCMLLSACKKEEAPVAESRDLSAEAPTGFAPPAIAIKAAPGVAFRYNYTFVLPDKSISAIQEQHAAACEKLGVTQCRITGMHYRLIEEDRVAADLQFKLAPELARQFGKDGIAAVERAAGKLVEASIEGEDVGAQIGQSQGRSTDLQTRLKEIEAKLAAGSAKDAERAQLESEAAAIREQLASEKQVRSEGTAQLASTPMTFEYTGNTVFAFGDSPFGDAWISTVNSARTVFAGALLIIGTALPWLLLILLAIALWRTRPLLALRRFVLGRSATSRPVPAGEPGKELIDPAP